MLVVVEVFIPTDWLSLIQKVSMAFGVNTISPAPAIVLKFKLTPATVAWNWVKTAELKLIWEGKVKDPVLVMLPDWSILNMEVVVEEATLKGLTPLAPCTLNE